MFCYQCEETLNGKACTNGGVCGKTAEVSDLQDELIFILKHIAKTDTYDNFIIDSLFATVTNTNFDPKYFRQKIAEAKTYVDVTDDEINKNAGILSEENEDLRSLKELLIYGLKGMAAYLHHARVLGYEEKKINDFVKKALLATLEKKSAEELTALVLECGKFGVDAMKLLDLANTKFYGSPEPTNVSIDVGKNPGILISGHDLKDMENLLKQTENSGVDVYTHGEMLPANAYPEFKKYGHLKGNYGGSWWRQKTEFEKFNGPILMTTNCLVPPKESYKDRIYMSGVVGFIGLKRVDDDFTEIIEHAKTCKAPEKLEDGLVTVGYAHDSILSASEKIIAAVNTGRIRKFIVMAGCDGRHDREYYTEFAKALPKDTVILTAGCAKYRYNKLGLGDIDGIPRVIDAGQCNDSYSLIVVAGKLAEAFGVDINTLPITYNIAWFEQKAVLVLLSLLSIGVKNIHLGPKLPAFVSPGVLKVLQDKFGLMSNSTVEEDLRVLA